LFLALRRSKIGRLAVDFENHIADGVCLDVYPVGVFEWLETQVTQPALKRLILLKNLTVRSVWLVKSNASCSY